MNKILNKVRFFTIKSMTKMIKYTHNVQNNNKIRKKNIQSAKACFA